MLSVNLLSTVDDLILQWASKTPEAPVLLGNECDPLSYQELAKIVQEFRIVLAQSGFGRNDRIAIVHSGGAEMAAAIAAIICSATIVPLNPDLSVGEFSLHLQDKKVQALALQAGLDTPARSVAQRLEIPTLEIEHQDKTIAGKVVLRSALKSNFELKSKPVQADDLMLVITTSGTTSFGKIVPLKHRHCLARARQIAQMLQLVPDDRAINLMPMFHVGGLSAGLTSCLFSGSSFLPLNDGHIKTLFHCLDQIKPSYIAAGYTTFHAIERNSQQYSDVIDRVKRNIRMLRTGAGHLDEKVAKNLEKIFEAPVVEAYGSSETGFMSCTGIPPMQRKQGSVGKPNRSCVSILGQDGNVNANMVEGEVVVRGDGVFEGYANDHLANEGAFKNGWYQTGDEGYLDEEGFLFLTGRIKEMINRGGMKITPSEIEVAMMKHPKIKEAIAFPISHPTLGEDVGAAIVLERDTKITDADLGRFLKQYLTPYKIPRRVVFVDEIPKSAIGKVQRWKLEEQLDMASSTGHSALLNTDQPDTLTPTEAKLQLIWQDAMGLDHVGRLDNFFALGGDSLQAVELFLRVEKELGRYLHRDILFEAETIAYMARLIDEDIPTGCVVPIKPEGDRPPFFCIHSIGGEVIGYRQLAHYLENDQPVYGIQYPQSEPNIHRFSTVEEMATYYVSEIRKIQPFGPYYIGGHSFGGLVAYVIAQQLLRGGEKTALLALFDTYSTGGTRYISPLRWLIRHQQVFVALSSTEKPDYIFQRIRNVINGVTRSLRLRLLSILKPSRNSFSNWQRSIVDINAKISRKFAPTQYEGNAVLFSTELPVFFNQHPHDNWKKLIKGNLIIRHVLGGHTGMLQEPYVGELARELTDCLKKY